MSGKFALIIGNTEYADPGLAQLTAPGKDTEDFARVLKDQEIGAFDDVNILLNQPEPVVRGAIDEFFDQKKPDDLLVLYFSGHGVRDELGALFLAVKNTIRSRLRSTAVKSDYIREVMDQSRSKRQVLILDCCNSGAFSQGTKAATGVSIGTASAFEGGYGRIILTASDSTQFAWEGDKVIGETDNSLFTHYLVEGLEGEADLDGDGRITVDELYDYAYEKVKLATPKQTPSKFSSKQQGEIVLRQSMRVEDMKPVLLPTPLLDSIENPFSDVRLGAVQQLIKLLNGKNLGLAHSAREALEQIAEEDDSRQVQRAAAQALVSVREVEQVQVQKAEPKRKILEGAKPDHVEAQKMEVPPERITKQIVSKPATDYTIASITYQQGILWITLGWVVAGFIGGAVYWAGGDFSLPLGGAIGWGIGGFVTTITLRARGVFSREKNIYWVTLAWIIGGIIGWTIGDAITEAYGAGIGGAIGLVIALASTLGFEKLLSRWKSMLWLILVWAISGAVGWSIGKAIQEAEGFLFNYSLYIGKAAGWGIGWAIAGVIGGYVLGWQLLKETSKSDGEISHSSQPRRVILTENQKAFLLSWQGRTLSGVIAGMVFGLIYGIRYGIINGITYDFIYAYSHSSEPQIFLLIACGVAGLITYPHKLSIAFLLLGSLVPGIINYPHWDWETSILAGAVFGFPLGALISRILYWMKIIK